MIPQSQSALAWRRGGEQLLQIIISVCLNLLERHTSGPGQLRWCQVSQLPKGKLNRFTLYCPTCQNSSGAPHELKQMLLGPGSPPLNFTFCSPFSLRLSPVSMSLFTPTLSDFLGVVNVTPFCQWKSTTTHKNNLDIQAVASEQRRNQSGPCAHDRCCYLSFDCHWEALQGWDLFIRRGTLTDVE